MKSILLITPKFRGYENILKSELGEKYDHLHTVDYDESILLKKKLPMRIIYIFFLVVLSTFGLRGVAYKLNNVLLKKQKKALNKFIYDKIDPDVKYDVCLIIKGFGLDRKVVGSINADYKTLYIWDSLYRYPGVDSLNGIFDEIYTFDKKDALTQGWKYLPNFYQTSGITVQKDKTNDIDIFYVGAFTVARFFQCYKVVRLCEKNGLTFHIKLIVPRFLSWIKHPIISSEFVTNKEYVMLVNRSRCILELSNYGHNGYTQRYYEAEFINKLVIVETKYEYLPLRGILLKDLEKIDLDVITHLEKKLAYYPKSQFIRKCTVSNWVSKVTNKE
ncbi:hypothetical protein C9980_20360 [Vibrio mediterranei]|uniref:hypothetical protein n=1 Tax=Vibrio mediterranei TaxID=689 RepID=UPI000D1834C5|nr:hypothetical protein [Vibrio mediterranei]PTC02972.1 hypothetical protein C9980_20360 [Vibrio mediterranei]